MLLKREVKVLRIEKDIQNKVNEQMDKNQRDYYLREQMRAISNELDDYEDTREDAENVCGKNSKKRNAAAASAGKAVERGRPPAQNAGQHAGGGGHPHLSGHLPGPAVGRHDGR